MRDIRPSFLYVILGLCYDHFGSCRGHVRIMLRSFWDQLRITSGPFWGHAGITLGSWWDHFWNHLRITLGLFRDHFGIISWSPQENFPKLPTGFFLHYSYHYVSRHVVVALVANMNSSLGWSVERRIESLRKTNPKTEKQNKIRIGGQICTNTLRLERQENNIKKRIKISYIITIASRRSPS